MRVEITNDLETRIIKIIEGESVVAKDVIFELRIKDLVEEAKSNAAVQQWWESLYLDMNRKLFMFREVKKKQVFVSYHYWARKLLKLEGDRETADNLADAVVRVYSSTNTVESKVSLACKLLGFNAMRSVKFEGTIKEFVESLKKSPVTDSTAIDIGKVLSAVEEVYAYELLSGQSYDALIEEEASLEYVVKTLANVADQFRSKGMTINKIIGTEEGRLSFSPNVVGKVA